MKVQYFLSLQSNKNVLYVGCRQILGSNPVVLSGSGRWNLGLRGTLLNLGLFKYASPINLEKCIINNIATFKFIFMHNLNNVIYNDLDYILQFSQPSTSH